MGYRSAPLCRKTEKARERSSTLAAKICGKDGELAEENLLMNRKWNDGR